MSTGSLQNGFSDDNTLTVTIAEDEAVSADIYIGNNAARRLGCRGLGIFTLGDWTDADIGFDVSFSGEDEEWQPARDEEGAVARITGVPTSGGFDLLFPAGAAWNAGSKPYVRIRSINTASDANLAQEADRTLIISLLR